MSNGISITHVFRCAVLPIMLLCAARGMAANRRFISRVDSILTTRLERMQAKVDSDYIRLPDNVWVFRGLANVGQTSADIRGNYGDSTRYRSNFNTDVRTSMTLTASYRGFVAGFTVNPARWAGRNKDMELYILGYGNRFGIEALLQSANTYSGNIRLYNTKGTLFSSVAIDKGYLSQRGITLNAYYALNYKHFSYPAAFTHAYVQTRSAGSLMFNASYQLNQLTRSNMLYENENLLDRITTNMIGVGAGYAYNFVPSYHWLIHISCLPSFIVFQHNTLHYKDNNSQRMHYTFPEVIIFAQHSTIYSWKNFFAGINMSLHFSNIGQDNIYYDNLTWRMRALFGVRI